MGKNPGAEPESAPDGVGAPGVAVGGEGGHRAVPPPPAGAGAGNEGNPQQVNPRDAIPAVSPEPNASDLLRWFAWLFVVAYLLAALVLAVLALVNGASDRTLFGLGSRRWMASGFTIANSVEAQRAGHFSANRRRQSTILHVADAVRPLVSRGGDRFGLLLGRAMFEHVDLDVVLQAKRWGGYLILLGGPFAATVLANGIVMHRLDTKTLQKADLAFSPDQILTNEKGNVDSVDSQYVLFILIAFAPLVIVLWSASVPPDMPGPQLAMTGAAAGLYVGNKPDARNRPLIHSMSPATAEPVDVITILGQNFDPADKLRALGTENRWRRLA